MFRPKPSGTKCSVEKMMGVIVFCMYKSTDPAIYPGCGNLTLAGYGVSLGPVDAFFC